jgi:hypothetical protein
MTVTVAFDPRCLFDFSPRTPENRALVKEYVNDLRQRLGEHKGILPRSKRVSDDPLHTYVWEDENWRIGYTVEFSGNLLLGRRRSVLIRSIQLKERPVD